MKPPRATTGRRPTSALTTPYGPTVDPHTLVTDAVHTGDTRRARALLDPHDRAEGALA